MSATTFLCLVLVAAHASAGLFAQAKTDNANNADHLSPFPYLRGVPAHLVIKYTAQETFTCDNGSKVLPISSINDNFCDCDDSTDEPGTSACINAIFHCVNSGYRITTVPSSRVDDGVCDCCDGSDEGIVAKCPDTCEEKAIEERKVFEKLTEGYERGSSIRAGYIAKMEARRDEIGGATEGLEEELSAKEAEVIKHQEMYDGHEDEVDAKERVLRQTFLQTALALTELRSIPHTQIASLLSAAFTILDMTETEVGMQVNHFLGRPDDDVGETFSNDFTGDDDEYGYRDAYSSQYDGEGMGASSDAAVPPAQCALNADSSDERLAPLCAFEEDAWASEALDFILHIVEEKEAFAHIQLLMAYFAIHQHFDNAMEFVLEHIASSSEGNQHCPADFASLNQKYCTMSVSLRAEVETYRSSVKRDANPYKEMLNSAVAERDAVNERMQDATEGRADIETYADYVEYVALKGQSFPVVDGHFKYNLIVMDKLEQREKEGHGVNTLGSFDGIRLEPDGAVVMTFTDGDYCWATQGPRTAEVRVTCAPENRLASVTEPSVCNYHAAFESPAACNPLYAEHVLGMSI